MFSIEEDNLEQTLLCEAAALAAACDPTDDPVALLTLCSPDIADYYTGKRQTKPHHDDPQGFFRDWGYVGILEYLLQAEDVQRDIILPLCLDCLDYQDILAQSSDQPITDFETIGAFVRETTSRLVQLANTHLSVREAINETIWDWCNGFLSLIAKGESQTKLQLGLVSLAGVFQALSVSPVIATLPYISDFLHTAFTTLDFERLQSNEASYNSPTGIEHFTLHDRQCEPADVVHAIFDYIHHVLLSTIKYSAQPATWKDLGKFSLHEGQDMLESDKIAIRSLFNMCWRFLPSPMLQHLLNDMHRSSTYHKALPVVVQSGILCVFQCPDLGPALFSALATVLQEKDPTFVCRAGPDIYLSALEGVATIIRGYPELRSHARKALLTFLRDPSAAFTQWANDPDAISAMRNCGSRVLLLTLQAEDSISLTASVLETCIDTFKGIMVKGIKVNPWSSAWQKGLAQQNCAVAIATIARILSKQEILKVITVAFEGALYDSHFPCHDLIWECLGNMGLTCEPEIFHLVLSTLGRQGSRKGRELRRILARGAAKSPVFSAVFLQQVLNSFIEKTMRTSAHTSGALKELYEIAWIAKVICAETHIGDDNPAIQKMSILFRDFWLCAVVFVLQPNGKWPNGWKTIMHQIASKSPPMTDAQQERLLEADLQAHSILGKTFMEESQQRVRRMFSEAFATKAPVAKTYSFPKCAYLLMVQHLEILRARRASIKTILVYLIDDRLYNDDAYDLLYVIGNEVVSTFLSRSQSMTVAARLDVEERTMDLLYTAASRLGRARTFSVNTIRKMLSKLPWLLWSRTVVYRMLDIMQCLDPRFQHDMARRGLLQEKVGIELTFLNDSDVIDAASDFFDFCREWIETATAKSTNETMGMLQGYMVDLHTNYPELALHARTDFTDLLARVCSNSEILSTVVRSSSKQALYHGEIRGMLMVMPLTVGPDQNPYSAISKNLGQDLRAVVAHTDDAEFAVKLHAILHRAAALILLSPHCEYELLELICWTPMTIFTTSAMDMTISVWDWLLCSRPDLAPRIFACIVAVWESSAQERKGLYSEVNRSQNPFYVKMTYTPSNKLRKHTQGIVHLNWLKFLLDRFDSACVQNPDIALLYAKLYQVAHSHVNSIQFSWPIRETYFLLLSLGSRISRHLELRGHPVSHGLWSWVLDDCLRWFCYPGSFGTVDDEILRVIIGLYRAISAYRPTTVRPSVGLRPIMHRFTDATWRVPGWSTRVNHVQARKLLMLLLEHEIHRLAAWQNSGDQKKVNLNGIPGGSERSTDWSSTLKTAWSIDPRIAIQMGNRFNHVADELKTILSSLCDISPASVLTVPEALPYILKNANKLVNDHQLRYILHWTAVPPITGVSLLGQQYKMQPWILQYAVRVLEHFPVDHVFFYIPQMVQALRYDTVGYIEHFILLAAKTSQHFAHQIIWNMNANMFKFNKEGQADAPDSLKPTLERVQHKIINALSGPDKEFYEREFTFFTEITGISGKLKPLVEAGAPKSAKKIKIDEEMAKIKVDVGVYLPTNPESIVVDIDYKSGRPLQSHAKAPFMATFNVKSAESEDETDLEPVDQAEDIRWMSSIFKVGDDCRQDMLALQMISIFKSIFSKAGLDLYLFPYRVVATAPGCGVIEVIPSSTSRDMMGREQVNSLYDWFIASFGREDCVGFRKAQYEFIKSLAAYSIVSFILQIKDRHNGNIMFDSNGHMVHIDFGFMLSIAPGGGILEVAPFKLTTEMVQVMGGDIHTPQYRQFQELCVRAFLACRPYAEELCQLIALMMESGLPCFKGEVTMRRLRERFQMDKSEKQAADFMLGCIKQSHENTRSGLYDRFQYLQNGIPY